MNTVNISQKFKYIITVLFGILLLPFVPAPVLAQDRPPICDNPGPYQICIPDTDITIGSVTITDDTLLLFAGIFLVGTVYTTSGLLLKRKSSN